MGALTTDFTLIRPGSLHKANGGYLVLPIAEVITSPLSWESLKHALQNKEIIVEDAARDKLGVISTKSLKPDPIPLNVKVILVGRPDIYQALLAYDEHFTELFKVKADFDTQMERTAEHINDYAAFISKICEEEQSKTSRRERDGPHCRTRLQAGGRPGKALHPLWRDCRCHPRSQLLRQRENAPLISAAHVRQAIDERFYRSALIQERIKEMILRDEIKIDVDGEKCGQVNGLSVIQMGDIEFGQPSRITVSIGLGREGLIDIEREAKLGGPLHTKGVLILSGYLTDKYAQDTAAQPGGAPGLRTKLFGRGRRQRLQHRAVRHPVRAIRPADSSRGSPSPDRSIKKARSRRSAGSTKKLRVSLPSAKPRG